MSFVVHIDTSLSVLHRVVISSMNGTYLAGVHDEPGLWANNFDRHELIDPLSSPQILLVLETISSHSIQREEGT
jgi:hypothetical protein